jgi:paraquat-inducible protein B
MAKQANSMMIGIFVVIAVTLLAASLVIFSSGKFFKKTVSCVMYFDESVRGLNVGAPVLFQGVPIGSVSSIVLQVDPAKMQLQIPVIIEFEPDKFTVRAEDQKITRDPHKNIPRLIDKGLRAQLAMQSFITGQLLVELDFHPGTPISLKGLSPDYIEIPTIPSTGERLARALGELDLRAIEKHLMSVLGSVDRLVSSPDLTASLRAMKETLQDTRKLVNRVERQVDPVASDLKKTIKEIGKVAREADGKVNEVTSGLDKTMSAARNVLSQDSPLLVELENTLKELGAMSRSVRELADYLEQHPASLIRGKKSPDRKLPGGE